MAQKIIPVLEANACHYVTALQITSSLLEILLGQVNLGAQGTTEEYKVKLAEREGRLDRHIHCWQTNVALLQKQARKKKPITTYIFQFALMKHIVECQLAFSSFQAVRMFG